MTNRIVLAVGLPRISLAQATDEVTLSVMSGPRGAKGEQGDPGSVAGVPPIATTAEYLANSAPGNMLTPGAVWGAGAVFVVTDAATVTLNFSTGLDFDWTLNVAGASRTFANPTNVKPGQKGIIYITQDATGGRTITWGTSWKFPGGTKPTLSTAANATDIISYVISDATWIACTFSADMK